MDAPRMKRPAERLKSGQMIDLEGDLYADRGDHDFRRYYQSNFAVVDQIERDAEGVTVHFESTPSVRFPLGHMLLVAGIFTESRQPLHDQKGPL